MGLSAPRPDSCAHQHLHCSDPGVSSDLSCLAHPIPSHFPWLPTIVVVWSIKSHRSHPIHVEPTLSGRYSELHASAGWDGDPGQCGACGSLVGTLPVHSLKVILGEGNSPAHLPPHGYKRCHHLPTCSTMLKYYVKKANYHKNAIIIDSSFSLLFALSYGPLIH